MTDSINGPEKAGVSEGPNSTAEPQSVGQKIIGSAKNLGEKAMPILKSEQTQQTINTVVKRGEAFLAGFLKSLLNGFIFKIALAVGCSVGLVLLVIGAIFLLTQK